MRNSYFRYSGLAALAGALVLAAGCGRASDNTLYPNSGVPIVNPLISSCGVTSQLNTCLSGYVRTAGGSCMAQYGYGSNADFASRCSISYSVSGSHGVPVNASVCRFQSGINFQSFGMTVLTPGLPCGGFNTGLVMKPGDRLKITSASGKWGVRSFSSDRHWIFDIVTLDSNSCEQVSETGYSSSNQQATNGGLPAGIVGSDGVNVFAVGTGISNFPVAADGMLRIGFNIPADVQLDACSSTGIQLGSVSVAHCEDTAGNTVSCP
ncbi:MAG TPA: hypothetical protein DCS07_06945 [Bdellovibrionales bacterium]|nr:MAG: hypothetical protein A2Z97_07130 [Bdellovibrionales bacterium GWB1_52_6]OFZ04301.1 MAG: hypothetical protein A2X97_06545 [Bdellovibrionales bacterium GWA1_52_35]HAR42356.1 hypothetical protein [Bdellovibrionales bacterium]HCM40850.1 hypothetical protein [Bdellovibrionales bacterium]